MAKRKAQKRPIDAAWNANQTRPGFEWECPACGKSRHFFLSPTLRNPHNAKCINTAKHQRPIHVLVRWPPPGNMVENELPNRQIAAIADQFRVLVFSMQNELGPTTPVAALLMNASFCLELYLKCLNAKLVYHGADFEDAEAFGLPTTASGHRKSCLDAYEVTSSPIKRGHDLIALLDAIPESVRRELDRRFRRTSMNSNGKTFRTVLAPYRTLFEEIRYVFELPSNQQRLNRVSISELCKLVEFLSEFTQPRISK
jgi:hypothetical protein